MRKISRFIVGAMMGALITAVIVLLFTPKSGDELRRQFNERIQNISAEIRQATEQRRKELEQELARLRAHPEA